MRRPITATLAVLAVLLTPVAASALEPGVHVNPGSPSGKEYALPLTQARHGAGGSPSPQHPGGGGGPNQSPATSDPRFGQGITPARGASSHTSGPAAAPSGRSPSRAASGTVSGGQAAPGADSSFPPIPAVPARAGLVTPRGSSSSGWILGTIAAVVVLGSALALVLRRRGFGF